MTNGITSHCVTARSAAFLAPVHCEGGVKIFMVLVVAAFNQMMNSHGGCQEDQVFCGRLIQGGVLTPLWTHVTYTYFCEAFDTAKRKLCTILSLLLGITSQPCGNCP